MRLVWIALVAAVVIGALWGYGALADRFYKRGQYGRMVLLTFALIALYLVAHYGSGAGDDYSFHI